MFATIHEKTLIDVTTLLVGPQATAAILAVYQLVDKAQAEAYELGTHDAQQVFAATQDQAWDAGYEQAERDNNADAAYDTGYITGVADARARPAEADENVAEIVEAAAEETYDVFDPSEYTPVDDEDESGRCPCGDPSCEYNN